MNINIYLHIIAPVHVGPELQTPYEIRLKKHYQYFWNSDKIWCHIFPTLNWVVFFFYFVSCGIALLVGQSIIQFSKRAPTKKDPEW
jgi:hypothetical protein